MAYHVKPGEFLDAVLWYVTSDPSIFGDNPVEGAFAQKPDAVHCCAGTAVTAALVRGAEVHCQLFPGGGMAYIVQKTKVCGVLFFEDGTVAPIGQSSECSGLSVRQVLCQEDRQAFLGDGPAGFTVPVMQALSYVQELDQRRKQAEGVPI